MPRLISRSHRLRRLWSLFALALALAAPLGALTGGKAAHAQTTEPPGRIIPFLSDITYNPARLEMNATFGYTSTHKEEVIIPIGAENVFSPPPVFKGQITRFLPGTYHNAFQATWRYDLYSHVIWTLRDRKVDIAFDLARLNPPMARIKELEAKLAASEATIAALAGEVAAYEGAANGLIRGVQSDYRFLFRDPAFVVPGVTTIDQLLSLRGALTGVNVGTKRQVYRALGGGQITL